MDEKLLIIIPCGAAKVWQNNPDLGQVMAGEAYVGALFKVNKKFAETYADRWMILSARYGFIDPDRFILNYNDSFNRPGPCTIRTECLSQQIRERNMLGFDRVICLGGEAYRCRAKEAFSHYDIQVECPVKGKRIGEMMQFIKQYNPRNEPGKPAYEINPVVLPHDGNAKRKNNLNRFYFLLDQLKSKLGGYRRIGDCRGIMGWPEQGVYFIFNPDESRQQTAGLRVVRVGTHALQPESETKLWGRLRQHRGPINGHRAGGGNHRGSVFRKHVGRALMARENWPESVRSTWDEGNAANPGIRKLEQPYEEQVSNYIRALSVLWLRVEGHESHKVRAYLEQNAIALLSNHQTTIIDPPSGNWLGKFSPSLEIRQSGLWNVHHVGQEIDEEFLTVLSMYIQQM